MLSAVEVCGYILPFTMLLQEHQPAAHSTRLSITPIAEEIDRIAARAFLAYGDIVSMNACLPEQNIIRIFEVYEPFIGRGLRNHAGIVRKRPEKLLSGIFSYHIAAPADGRSYSGLQFCRVGAIVLLHCFDCFCDYLSRGASPTCMNHAYRSIDRVEEKYADTIREVKCERQVRNVGYKGIGIGDSCRVIQRARACI